MGCALCSHKSRNSIISASKNAQGGIIFNFKLKKNNKTQPHDNHLITIYEADSSEEYSFKS